MPESEAPFEAAETVGVRPTWCGRLGDVGVMLVFDPIMTPPFWTRSPWAFESWVDFAGMRAPAVSGLGVVSIGRVAGALVSGHPPSGAAIYDKREGNAR